MKGNKENQGTQTINANDSWEEIKTDFDTQTFARGSEKVFEKITVRSPIDTEKHVVEHNVYVSEFDEEDVLQELVDKTTTLYEAENRDEAMRVAKKYMENTQ